MGRVSSEAYIERRTVERAFKELGVESYKLAGAGKRGKPDRLFLFNHAGVLFIEFKRPGERSTPLQLHEQKKLKNMGFRVLEADSVEVAMDYIRFYASAFFNA